MRCGFVEVQIDRPAAASNETERATECDLLVADETSMVDVPLMRSDARTAESIGAARGWGRRTRLFQVIDEVERDAQAVLTPGSLGLEYEHETHRVDPIDVAHVVFVAVATVWFHL